MIDHVRDIRNSMETLIQTTLGSGYKKLQFVEDVTKNNFRTNSERYGVRALTANEVPGVTKTVQVTQSFEVVLTKAYYESNLDDTEQLEASLDNFENIHDIYKEIVNQRAGLPSIVLNTTDMLVSEPEYIEESKVAILRATINITYRFSLL